jgi:hypothetical protein
MNGGEYDSLCPATWIAQYPRNVSISAALSLRDLDKSLQLAAKKKQPSGSSRKTDVVGFIVNEARVAHRHYRSRDLRRRRNCMARCDRPWSA